MNTRRSFLKNAAIVTPAMLFLPDMLLAARKKGEVGIQLYTLRDLISKDPKGVLDKVAAAGYKKIEMFGYGQGKFFGIPVKEFAAYANSLGLVSPSGHYLPQSFLYEESEKGEAEMKDMIAAAVEMKHEYLVIPWLHTERRQNLDDYKKIAARLNVAGELCKNAGIQMAYHNHDFEFKSYDGTTGFDVFSKETDANLVKWELDLYWVVFAGLDPINLFNQHKGRVPLWHVKDMDKVKREQNTEIGNGSIDYKRIFKAAGVAGLKHFYVEQENNYVPEPIGSIQSSIKYIKANLV
ncbi:sugar phosphate isomerase/epimerase family protein [Flavihumibacter solisilvae]|uniref:Xylose isomerase n=1 Tax=Flavihumibacter solisilvae TaxID=1349421 RepID=A0A0C1IFQ9_9BACT|nr:sugar phosphate isomerase/epimerase [Flavihumibacter solisilvae]KIC92980.1 xylose isomerase [Flavihumibacter solisilvae]